MDRRPTTMTPSRRNSPHRSGIRPGFTLIELILVMAVLCIIAGLAVPMLNNFSRGRRPADCAAQVVAVAQWARTQAITQAIPYRLNLDPQSGTFWVTSRQPGALLFD